jgi:hypothetical protein
MDTKSSKLMIEDEDEENYTIVEESKEEDVSFNTRSNIFGHGAVIQSPIQRMGQGSGMVLSGGLGSEDTRNNPAVE